MSIFLFLERIQELCKSLDTAKATLDKLKREEDLLKKHVQDQDTEIDKLRSSLKNSTSDMQGYQSDYTVYLIFISRPL